MDDAIYVTPEVGFGLLADTYDARLSGTPAALLEWSATQGLLPALDGKRVGDIGCGTGRYALQLARLGAASVVGVDLAPEMLAVARRKARHAELGLSLVHGDLRTGTLPAAAGERDVVVCAFTLSFVEDLAAALAALAGTLAPGGVLVTSELHPQILCAERAASAAAFRSDRAPFLRFTDHTGRECRLVRFPHLISDYLAAASAAGLVLERLAEPRVDARLAATYAGLNERIGVPLTLTLRWRRPI